ncbi:ABC transporter permease [Flammeovirga kamogawensis]|uniref:ABC transporter permease n=1 Tax=Flammeovirga kamogawensis TaxID=373891 RepID=A0ABX8GUU5_9BACT|nr:ABC transporter permease [Flammeovirga kamogawensis]MBB6459813.1 putative ABC transport system permease protein [Flammeovirga kamogawensis]QWG07131.1 ABC transporter permease [Flammeovirga kamogawensis]TRX68953.1 FtsX-like permease family protein [Flammeovirga kamogawensis]
MQRYLINLSIALDAILANTLRSILTALGIIFGVAAVIAMLAIGNGAQQEILDQMKLVGVNNIVITPIIEQSEEKVVSENKKEKEKFSPGLSLLDLKNIKEVIPNIQRLSPEIEIETYIIKNGIRRSVKLIGVNNHYFEIYNHSLSQGNLFDKVHAKFGASVCIIGRSLQTRFFSSEDPIGKQIKCGGQWLTVVGVLNERNMMSKNLEKLGIRNVNMDVYVPIETMLIRFKDRSRVTKTAIQKASAEQARNNNQPNDKKANYNQLDKIVVQMSNANELSLASEVLQKMLSRRHFNKVDFEISIPEMLLKQQQRTKDIFNIVLGAIAGISLIVGGIGIMNIMLASVLERIKEIGLRISLGAKKMDIILQFLFEAILISLTGGTIGVILGVSMALLISSIADIPTIISFSSVIISFGVAASIGVIFGISPAKKAASQDPIESLRYE